MKPRWQNYFAAAGAALLVACAQDSAHPIAPTSPSLEIVDAVHMNGNGHFFFLPPLVPLPTYTGAFDVTANPTIEVCEWTGTTCGTEVASFTMSSGTGGRRIRYHANRMENDEVDDDEMDAPHFHARWDTEQCNSGPCTLDPDKTYRLTVRSSGFPLGHADLDIVETRRELRNVNTSEYIGLKNGRTLNIRFRVELVSAPHRITFTSLRDGNYEIYAMDADGSNTVRLTTNTAIDHSSEWSPDGSRIVFVSDRSGNQDIWIMNADGSGQTQLTTHGSDDYTPGWSADGEKIVFASKRDGNQEIYVMNADGTGQVNITNSPALDYWPRWSPDGTKIAFSSDRGGSQDIWVMSSTGTNPVQLTTDPAIDYTPAWSPNGQYIAFSTERFGGVEDVMIMSADGSNQTQLTNNPAEDFYPTFTDGGTRILFSSRRTGNYDLFTMLLDGSGLVQLPGSSFDDYAAHWR